MTFFLLLASLICAIYSYKAWKMKLVITQVVLLLSMLLFVVIALANSHYVTHQVDASVEVSPSPAQPTGNILGICAHGDNLANEFDAEISYDAGLSDYRRSLRFEKAKDYCALISFENSNKTTRVQIGFGRGNERPEYIHVFSQPGLKRLGMIIPAVNQYMIGESGVARFSIAFVEDPNDIIVARAATKDDIPLIDESSHMVNPGMVIRSRPTPNSLPTETNN